MSEKAQYWTISLSRKNIPGMKGKLPGCSHTLCLSGRVHLAGWHDFQSQISKFLPYKNTSVISAFFFIT